MIKIKLFSGKKIVGTANNIRLEPYSTSLLRKFYFDELEMKPTGDFDWDELLIIKVYNLTKQNTFYINSYIEVRIKKIINLIETKRCTIEGYVIMDKDYTLDYRQGVIDVYNYWKKNKELKFTKLPKNISLIDYIKACFHYSSISEITPEKNKVEIDFKYITNELEIVCSFAEEFMGKRSYMGRYFDTFDDCLLTLYNYRKQYFEDKSVILKHENLVFNDGVLTLIDEFKKILKKYKFNIIIM